MNIIDELEWRGAINQQTDAEGLYKLVDEKSISLYCGSLWKFSIIFLLS